MAISELGKSLDLDPNFAQAHLYLGRVYGEQERYEEALAELQKGVTISGGESEMAGALGDRDDPRYHDVLRRMKIPDFYEILSRIGSGGMGKGRSLTSSHSPSSVVS